jgi:ribosomal protein S18 acetylase RimI-like enzyme
MSAACTLRRAAAADYPADIAALHTLSWAGAYRGILSDRWLAEEMPANRLAYWQQAAALSPDPRRVWLAEQDGQPRGFICLMPQEDPAWGGYIDNLHVHPAAQGSGLGRRLMAQAARWWQEEGRSEPLHLCVFVDNARARAFYERIGGSLAETFDEEFYGQPVTTCRYQWRDVAALAAASPH